jgi:hypothetical protein
MEYDLSYDDSPSLKQTLADLLRGMSKKQAYQEIGQGIQNVAKVTPSVVESLGRGAIAQVPGTFGDISELARQFAPETMQNVIGNRVAPTTEEILAKIPRLNPDYQGSNQHETIGGLISPAMPSLLRAGAKATQNMPIGNMIKEVQSPFVPNVKAGEEMIVRHNLTPEKLYAADKLGAMPVPSLGITKTGYVDPLADFGDITLIGGKEMAVPSKANPVYSADAYTIRRPHLFTKTDAKANEFLTKKLAEPYGQLADDSNVKSDISNTLRNLDSNLENSSLLKMKYLENQGMLPNSQDFKTASEFRRAARDKFDQLPQSELTKFYDWQPEYISKLRDEAVQAGGTIKDQLFKGRSNVTGRELYEPATVENIVKRMSKAKPGDEGNFYTAGSLRGKLVPKLKNEQDIQKSRDKIISADDFEAFKEKISNKHSDINLDLHKFLEQNKSGIDANAFLEELALGTANKYEYSRDLAKKVPQELKDRISAYVKELKEAPTGYFEIKPKRAVGIGEFKGAIVPSDVSPKTMSILEKNGIKDIYKYGSANERKSLVQKFGKEMFAGVPIIGLSRKEQLEEQFNNIKK